jgi:hypothetical protein
VINRQTKDAGKSNAQPYCTTKKSSNWLEFLFGSKVVIMFYAGLDFGK